MSERYILFILSSRKTVKTVEEIRFDFYKDSVDQDQLDGARSVVDSGVGNTSVHVDDNASTADALQQGQRGDMRLLDHHVEGPVMTSSPRPSRDEIPAIVLADRNEDADTEISTPLDSDDDGGDTGRVIRFENAGETGTDDELDDEDYGRQDENLHRIRSRRKSNKHRSSKKRDKEPDPDDQRDENGQRETVAENSSADVMQQSEVNAAEDNDAEPQDNTSLPNEIQQHGEENNDVTETTSL